MTREGDSLQAHQRLRVLYDPVSYMPGWSAVAATLSGERRTALNDAVVRLHALPAFEPSTRDQARWTQRLIRDWASLPAAAYLTACSLWREPLASLPVFQSFEPQVHVFLQFRFPALEVPASDAPRTRAELTDWGGAYLASLLPDLPDWLRSRIRVRFTPLPPACRSLPQARSSDLLCFSMALAHAQKDPGFSRSVCP